VTAASFAGQAVLDVYLAAIAEMPTRCEPACAARRRALARTKDPGLKRQRACAWHLLELAAGHSFGLDARELAFSCDGTGRWSCGEMEFSLSHSAGAVAAAVSDRPVGVDIEEIRAFAARCGENGETVKAMLRRIAAPEELTDSEGREAETLLRLWTGKESLFKSMHDDGFLPKSRRCGAETKQFVVPLPPELCLAVSGERIEALRIFAYRPDGLRRLDAAKLPGGTEALRSALSGI